MATQTQVYEYITSLLKSPTAMTAEDIVARTELHFGYPMDITRDTINGLNQQVVANQNMNLPETPLGNFDEERERDFYIASLLKEADLSVAEVKHIMKQRGLEVTEAQVMQGNDLRLRLAAGEDHVEANSAYLDSLGVQVAEDIHHIGQLYEHMENQEQAKANAPFYEEMDKLGMDEVEYHDMLQAAHGNGQDIQEFQREHNMNLDGTALTDVQRAALL